MFEQIDPIHVTDSRIPLPSLIGRFIDCDSFHQNDNRFCVADGITRDLTNGDEFKLPRNAKDALKFLLNYPQLSELRAVANTCTTIFTSSNKTELKELLEQINISIRFYNDTFLRGQGQYLGRNNFGVTAAGGIIDNNRLKGFNIGDSNIILLDKFCDTIAKTKDDVKDNKEKREKYIIEEHYPEIDNIDVLWHNNEFRSWYRETFINTSAVGSFGALNGDEEALDHINYYDFDLNRVHFILSYTDGFEETMENKNKTYQLLYKKRANLGKEATMVGYKRRI